MLSLNKLETAGGTKVGVIVSRKDTDDRPAEDFRIEETAIVVVAKRKKDDPNPNLPSLSSGTDIRNTYLTSTTVNTHNPHAPSCSPKTSLNNRSLSFVPGNTCSFLALRDVLNLNLKQVIAEPQ